ncbi:PepSY-associated transmembrane protein [Methylobacter tundripaludum]|uniref:PepSY-associated transmembrane protein n=1 Tax=Methylobacter tundripaludum TaxID=173365 RepID=A0A2S6GJK7_9GAMM|nr:PepSY-associated transmembrane protein [Methylobacter tundripaludum]
MSESKPSFLHDLFLKHAHEVNAFIRGRGPREQDVDDIMQEFFFAVVASSQPGNPHQPASLSVPNTLIDFVFKLHYALLIKPHDVSTVAVGLSGALLMISVLTGLIVWWPLTGRWRQALTVKPKSGGIRCNYDLHKVFGSYTALVMLPVLFSGIYMVLPHNVVPVLELFSPVTYRYWFHSTPPTGNAQAIGMDQAVAIARQRYPAGRTLFTVLPNRPKPIPYARMASMRPVACCSGVAW